MGKPNKPSYPIPKEVRNRVHYDITSTIIRNKNVLVVGGGDSASEYVQYLHQENNSVTLSYRQQSFTRMNEINRDSLLALEREGHINILLNSHIEGVSPTEEKEQVAVHFAQEKIGSLHFDNVVLALGGTTPKNFLQLLGIEFNQDQPLIKDGFETSVPGLFLIGDLSAGKRGGSIITAFNSSHQAMRKLCDTYLNCKL